MPCDAAWRSGLMVVEPHIPRKWEVRSRWHAAALSFVACLPPLSHLD